MKNEPVISQKQIENRIFTIRGVQVMLDRDLAEMYNVETKVLNQAVKRNIDRFPSDFMFQISETELKDLKSQIGTSNSRSQIVTLNNKRGQNIKYLPYAFTEQGVAGLSGVLKSETAAKVHVAIMRAFVVMRKYIQNNQLIFSRLDIDNYIDENTLTHLAKKKKGIKALLLTKNTDKQLNLDIQKANAQYGDFDVKQFTQSHDRFLIIDNKDVYHLGASLKDLGKKWFAFSKMDKSSVKDIINAIAELI